MDIGTGMIGSTVGALWVKAGHRVKFAARDQGRLDALVKKLGARASSGTIEEVIDDSDVVLFAAPFGAWPDLAAQYGAKLKGKITLDAANPYPQRDGRIAEDVIKSGVGAGAYTAGLLPGAHVVKAFNTIYFETLAKESNRAGERIGMAIAGDNAEALAVAERLVDDAGFDPVVLPAMARSKDIDPGTPVYAKAMSANDLRQALHLGKAA